MLGDDVEKTPGQAVEQPSSNQPEVGGVAITRASSSGDRRVCVLSAAIGSGDQPDRPDRARRARAESGARAGRAGRRDRWTPARSKPKSKPCAAKPDTSELEEEVLENEERLEELEDALRSAGRSSSELCGEDEFFC